jgi:hypothetical protein
MAEDKSTTNLLVDDEAVSMHCSELPVCCPWILKRGRFRVLRAKGKALASGGFDVATAAEQVEEDPKKEASRSNHPAVARSTQPLNVCESRKSSFSINRACYSVFLWKVLQKH